MTFAGHNRHLREQTRACCQTIQLCWGYRPVAFAKSRTTNKCSPFPIPCDAGWPPQPTCEGPKLLGSLFDSWGLSKSVSGIPFICYFGGDFGGDFGIRVPRSCSGCGRSTAASPTRGLGARHLGAPRVTTPGRSGARSPARRGWDGRGLVSKAPEICFKGAQIRKTMP